MTLCPAPVPQESGYHRRLDRVVRHIQHHLDQPLTVDGLAEVANFSPYHFHRLFTAMMGETVAQYIRRLRMERAAWHLRYSRRTVTAIAFDCGFEATESFSRIFRAHFGLPPSRWRRDRSVFAPAPAPTGETAMTMPLHRPAAPAGLDITAISVTTLPARTVASLRHTGPYTAIGPVFDRLMALAGQKGLLTAQTQVIQISYDDPRQTDADKLRADACITLHGPLPDVADLAPLVRQDIPEGRYARILYTGPYSGLDAAYSWLYASWLPDSGHQVAHRPCQEIYLNSPATTAPEHLQTLILLPVE